MSQPDVQLRSALLSVFDKTGLEEVARALHAAGVKILATGGTADFIAKLGLPVTEVADLTGYPSILGGRVKTLHPAVFGGILARRSNPTDLQELDTHNIGPVDCVVVDLYPFSETVRSTTDEQAIIEKIDIGGVSLLRAAAKNHADVLVVPSIAHYPHLLAALKQNGGKVSHELRKAMAREAFAVTARYDSDIHAWMAGQLAPAASLRYGENPHQAAQFIGNLEAIVTKHNGKELSYNNLLDLDAALRLVADFSDAKGHALPGAVTCAIIKHTNPCGVATRTTALDAWTTALASDPTSAFGGIIVLNTQVDAATAQQISEQFFEVLAAPSFAPEALDILKAKKTRILLTYADLTALAMETRRTVLNGTLVQHADSVSATAAELNCVTDRQPSADETADLLFAEKVAKHLKSNAIALVRNRQLIGGGMGQTSRIDSLRHAIDKARAHGFDTNGAVLASDAFFPFSDGVQLAHEAGIDVVLQPGGSVRDEEVIGYARANGMCMVLTGKRHFRH